MVPEWTLFWLAGLFIGCLIAIWILTEHYNKEKERIRKKHSYKLYNVYFIADGGIYTQVIGAKSVDEVKHIMQETYESDIMILSIDVMESKGGK